MSPCIYLLVHGCTSFPRFRFVLDRGPLVLEFASWKEGLLRITLSTTRGCMHRYHGIMQFPRLAVPRSLTLLAMPWPPANAYNVHLSSHQPNAPTWHRNAHEQPLHPPFRPSTVPKVRLTTPPYSPPQRHGSPPTPSQTPVSSWPESVPPRDPHTPAPAQSSIGASRQCTCRASPGPSP